MALDLHAPGYRRMLALYGGTEMEGLRRRVREEKKDAHQRNQRVTTRTRRKDKHRRERRRQRKQIYQVQQVDVPKRKVYQSKTPNRPHNHHYHPQTVDRMPEGKTERIVAGRWEVTSRIGKGNYGEVFKGRDVTNGNRVAVKLAEGVGFHLLQVEGGVYRMLNGGVNCVPRLWYTGRWGGGGVLVMGLCGGSLEEMRNRCGGKLTLKSVLMVGIQVTKGLEMIHAKGVLHRDVKPENLLMGRRHKKHVYVVDFGLSGGYREAGGRHVRWAGAGFVGTVKYASENVHGGLAASRRDDLISLGYTLVYLFKGRLPWEGRSMHDVGREKRRVDVNRLCQGMGQEMCTFFEHLKQLPFTHRPDYGYLVWLLESALKKRGWSNDARFEWIT